MQNILPVICFAAGFLLAWFLLRQRKEQLSDAFKALSADALRNNNQAIGDVLRPVKESLEKVDSKIQEMEKARQGAYSELTTQVRGLLQTQEMLRGETGRLVSALRTPSVRGHWGEMQLRRVVEMAGMLEYCDFRTQASVEGEAGRLRPDLLVRLPAGKTVVVDAKTPLDAYLRGVEATDDATRKLRMQDHARQVRDHLTSLGRKAYWQQFDPTPEFVVLFLPGECFFSAALEQDPTLIESGVNQNIILATPTTLIALLRAVAYGWKQEDLAANAKQISDLGAELYERIATMRDHWQKVGKGLENAVDAYNRAVGSLETRVLPSARKFVELRAATGAAMDEVLPVERTVRQLQSPEMAAGAGAGND